jgi:hypothetical protein
MAMTPYSLTEFDLERAELQSQGDVWAEAPQGDVQRYRDRVRDVLPMLPALDRDVLFLHVVEGYTQRQIGPMVGMTQQGVCRRLESAARRLRFLVSQPPIVDQLKDLLTDLMPAREAALLAEFAKTAHQSKVARRAGLSQQWTHTLCTRGLYRLLDHPSLLGQYLGAWFVLLAAQRYLYELPTRRPAKRYRTTTAPTVR